MKVLVLGVGAFAHSCLQILKEAGAEVCCYLTRDYGHFGPRQAAECQDSFNHPSPIPLIEAFQPDVVVPMSINWVSESWGPELIRRGVPILCPNGEALRIEGERQFSAELCQQVGIPVPRSVTVGNRLEATKWMDTHPGPYVIKNPLCSPYSPIHTIVCESEADTRGWLQRVDYAEGVFLQEYLGTAEIGHFVWVHGDSIQSLVTNQEYKKAFAGNMGPVAGAPLGGIVQQDPEDQYGLARQLIHPLRPWLKEVGFRGPLQVTALQKEGVWHAVEYNVRLGVTSGAMILKMLSNPLQLLRSAFESESVIPQWNSERSIGCSVTLAGYGYPYIVPVAPKLPVSLLEKVDCDLWWNEVDGTPEQLFMVHHKTAQMGHRIAEVVAFGKELKLATEQAYRNINKVRCLAAYYRPDIGQSLWPPGEGA